MAWPCYDGLWNTTPNPHCSPLYVTAVSYHLEGPHPPLSLNGFSTVLPPFRFLCCFDHAEFSFIHSDISFFVIWFDCVSYFPFYQCLFTLSTYHITILFFLFTFILLFPSVFVFTLFPFFFSFLSVCCLTWILCIMLSHIFTVTHIHTWVHKWHIAKCVYTHTYIYSGM